MEMESKGGCPYGRKLDKPVNEVVENIFENFALSFCKRYSSSYLYPLVGC